REPSRIAVRVLVSRAARTRIATATRAPRAARTAVAERPDGVGGGIADDDIADDSDADDFDVDGIAVGAADAACGGEGRGAGEERGSWAPLMNRAARSPAPGHLPRRRALSHRAGTSRRRG